MQELPLIMVAPNGARRTKADHPAIPITISETVEIASRCHKAGAGGLHAHVRDEEERHILDAGLYRELLKEMALAVPDMLVQITTEAVGRYSATEQRELVRSVMPNMVSVGMTEMHSDGNEVAARSFYHFADEAGIDVQHIVYSADELGLLLARINEGHIPTRAHQMIFVLGRYVEGQQSTPDMLNPFLKVLKASKHNHDWAVCAFGEAEMDCLVEAVGSGGKARIGFENSIWNSDGSLAESNEARVANLSQKI